MDYKSDKLSVLTNWPRSPGEKLQTMFVLDFLACDRGWSARRWNVAAALKHVQGDLREEKNVAGGQKNCYGLLEC